MLHDRPFTLAARSTITSRRSLSSELALVSGNGAAKKPVLTSHAKGYSKEGSDRVCTYYGQALLLLNVYGIPLSFGPYLEFYYTTMFPHARLWCPMLILAVQVICISAMWFPVGWLYQRKWKNAIMCIASGAVIAAQFALIFVEDWWLVLLLHGFVTGVGLGTLLTVGMLCLASHYRYNLSLISMESVGGGLLGATSYTLVAWYFLGLNDPRGAFATNTGISGSTLVAAWFLVKQSNRDSLTTERPQEPQRPFSNAGAKCFAVGYLLLLTGLFACPVYMILFISNPPSAAWPWHLALFQVGIFICSLFAITGAANIDLLRHLGPVNTFTLTSVLAGVSLICPAWMPYYWVMGASSFVYGCALGPIFCLRFKAAAAIFHSGKLTSCAIVGVRMAVIIALDGLSIAVGTVAVALIADHDGDGFRYALAGSGICMVLGGLLIGMGRWSRCDNLVVAI